MHILQKTIINFFEKLDRAFFMDINQDLASENIAVSIGHGQTISQPSLVLDMTLKLELNSEDTILEIGTGSGYQTAFLAEFCNHVHTVERIPNLHVRAKDKLSRLGYKNIDFHLADGSYGWLDGAPYDRIIVTAAAKKVPVALINQLGRNGRMIIPIGTKNAQILKLITKDSYGNVHIEDTYMVSFVPLVGEYQI